MLDGTQLRTMWRTWSAGVLARNKTLSARSQKPGEDARAPCLRLTYYRDALANLETVMAEWMETAEAPGRPIPMPRGRLMHA
jgi:hypothetical protein